jgi:hypothetical protein
VQGTRVLPVGHIVIMTDKMAQSGALRSDVTTTVADYGHEQVNREHTMGAGHKGVASGAIVWLLIPLLSNKIEVVISITTIISYLHNYI